MSQEKRFDDREKRGNRSKGVVGTREDLAKGGLDVPLDDLLPDNSETHIEISLPTQEVLNLVQEVDTEVALVKEESDKKLANKGASKEELDEAKKLGDELSQDIEQEKSNLYAELVLMSPILAGRVKKMKEAFKEKPTPEALMKRFPIENLETAKMYLELASEGKSSILDTRIEKIGSNLGIKKTLVTPEEVAKAFGLDSETARMYAEIDNNDTRANIAKLEKEEAEVTSMAEAKDLDGVYITLAKMADKDVTTGKMLIHSDHRLIDVADLEYFISQNYPENMDAIHEDGIVKSIPGLREKLDELVSKKAKAETTKTKIEELPQVQMGDTVMYKGEGRKVLQVFPDGTARLEGYDQADPIRIGDLKIVDGKKVGVPEEAEKAETAQGKKVNESRKPVGVSIENNKTKEKDPITKITEGLKDWENQVNEEAQGAVKATKVENTTSPIDDLAQAVDALKAERTEQKADKKAAKEAALDQKASALKAMAEGGLTEKPADLTSETEALAAAVKDYNNERRAAEQAKKDRKEDIKSQNIDALARMHQESGGASSSRVENRSEKPKSVEASSGSAKRVERQPTVEKRKEKVVRAEKESLPSEMLKLVSPDLRTRFQKLADGAKRFIVKNIWNPPVFLAKALYSKVEQKIVTAAEKVMRFKPGYRVGALFNTALMARQESGWLRQKGTLIDLSARHEARQKEIDALQAHLDQREEEISKMEQQYGALSDADRLRLDIEKTRVERRLNDIIARQDSVRSKLETANNNWKRHENARKELVNELIEKLNRRIKPYESRMESFGNKREKLTEAIEQFSKLMTEKEAKLTELDREAENNPGMKGAYKLLRKNILSTLKRGRAKIADAESERRDIDSRMTLINERLAPWLDMRNKYAAVTQESAVNYVEPKGRAVKADKKSKDLSFSA